MDTPYTLWVMDVAEGGVEHFPNRMEAKRAQLRLSTKGHTTMIFPDHSLDFDEDEMKGVEKGKTSATGLPYWIPDDWEL